VEEKLLPTVVQREEQSFQLNCLSKLNSLNNSKDFTALYQKGLKWVAPSMIIYTTAAFKPDVRVGFSVSRKLGGAVVRNRVKRRMRELVRHSIKEATLRGGDYAITVRTPFLTKSFQELQKEFSWAINHLRRMQDEKVS
jgi:ribonuclease P protein component